MKNITFHLKELVKEEQIKPEVSRRKEIKKRNEMEVFVMRWMELESVIQSEVSQKEKNKYSMLTHIYGI